MPSSRGSSQPRDWNCISYISNTGGGWGFPGGSKSKESAWNVGDLGLIPGLGRSPGEGNGYPLQYSCLENSRYREEPGRLQSVELQRIMSQKPEWLILSLFFTTSTTWGALYDLASILSLSCVLKSLFICVQLCQPPLSMGFSRQEYWSGLPCLPPTLISS